MIVSPGPHCVCSPALMIVSPERKVVAGNARTAVLDRPTEFPWEGAVDELADR